jgi:hypothetical protein
MRVAKSLSIYAVTVWCVGRIGIELSVEFRRPRPTTLAHAGEDPTPLDQYPLSSSARLTDWSFLRRLGVTKSREEGDIIDYFQCATDNQGSPLKDVVSSCQGRTKG